MSHAVVSTPTIKPPLEFGLRFKLSVMMFLQFAVWGGWFVFLGNHLKSISATAFTDEWVGAIYGTMALGTIIAPLFVGQVADRFFASEKLMAVLHIVGAGLLFWMGEITDPETFYVVALIYALVYSPTLALSNSIAFAHVPDGNRDFAGLRVLGTIGWIVTNLLVSLQFWLNSNFLQLPILANPFPLAALLSFGLGLFSLALPHTPPPGKAGDALPFLKALGLFKDFSFAVFFAVSFVIAIVQAFYFTFLGLFLETGVHVDSKYVTALSTIGQIVEMVLLPFLPWFLRHWGMKWVLIVGMLSWGLRYLLFSAYAQADNNLMFPLVLIGIALHGPCFDFFFASGFIHVDNKAPPDIRGSGQALFTFLTYGVGMWIGNNLCGQLLAYFTNEATGVKDWAGYWFVPAVGVILCLVVFVAFFRDSTSARPQEA
jgi:nucleoside transporter